MRSQTGIAILPTRLRISRLTTMAVISMASVGLTFAQSEQGSDHLYEEVLSSHHWRTFSQQVTENYTTPINEGVLKENCRKTISPRASRDMEAIIENCIRAAIDGLDSSATYISPAERTLQIEDSKRKFVGIGLELRAAAEGDGNVEVVSAVKRSPAERTGLRSGDLIYSIDGVSTRTLALMESVKVMRGEAGTAVTLLVRRRGEENPLKFVVTREPIRVNTVRSKILSPGLAYMRLSQLVDYTRNDMIADITKLEVDNGSSLNSIILDLRNCPGGLLNATIGVTALFVKPNTEILRVVGQREGMNRIYRASPDDYANQLVPQNVEPENWSLRSLRLIVLVNGKTGAGAEALAETLREKRQAVVMGQPTFGMTAIEQVFSLASGAAMRIATGEIASPQGHSWQGQGIKLDTPVAANEGSRWEFGELPADVQLVAAMAQFKHD